MLISLLVLFSVDYDVHLSDMHRFQFSPQECIRRWKFATAHCEWLAKVAPYNCEWAQEARWMRDCWDQLDNAKRHWSERPAYQRQALAKLKELIGADAYERGWMPEPAPFYRFIDKP